MNNYPKYPLLDKTPFFPIIKNFRATNAFKAFILAGIFQAILLSFIFLPSALPISGVCIIFSTFIALLHNKENINLKNKWNLAILLSAFLLIISTLFSYFNSDLNLELVDGNKAIIWIKLFNWLPFFLLFLTD